MHQVRSHPLPPSLEPRAPLGEEAVEQLVLVHAHPTQVATPSPQHTTQVVRPLPLHSLEGGCHSGEDQVGSLGQVALVAVLQ